MSCIAWLPILPIYLLARAHHELEARRDRIRQAAARHLNAVQAELAARTL